MPATAQLPDAIDRCLPVYIAIDTSASMAGDPIETVNDQIGELIRALAGNSRLADFVYMSVVAFSDDARTILPLSRAASSPQILPLVPNGRTNFGDLFRELRRRIEQDIRNLKDRGGQVYRPLVLLLTDGQPTDQGWERDFSELTRADWVARPNIVTFGFGNADERILTRLARGAAFVATDNYNTSGNVKNAVRGMVTTILDTASTGNLQAPLRVQGYVRLPTS
ncbi:VWA domain-containing protein [Micromonospora sp. NPDC005203]|uniref:vWA domain-containing protein n=1 Tax=Micromonospora sp. NPDC005203 TaxID=3364226 RepID=UPI00368E0278